MGGTFDLANASAPEATDDRATSQRLNDHPPAMMTGGGVLWEMPHNVDGEKRGGGTSARIWGLGCLYEMRPASDPFTGDVSDTPRTC